MSMLELPDSINRVELDWYADNDVIHVTPKNQRRFDIQKDIAIEVLQKAHESQRFGQQFGLLLDRLAQWIKTQEERISHAIVTLQDGSLAFVVIQKSGKYDEQFQDDLADVDLEIANDPDLDLIQLKTIVLPSVAGDSLQSFIDKRMVLTYGKRSRTHRLGEPESCSTDTSSK
jgi:hypothetical protein